MVLWQADLIILDIYLKIIKLDSGGRIVIKQFSAFRGCKEKLENMNCMNSEDSGINTFYILKNKYHGILFRQNR